MGEMYYYLFLFLSASGSIYFLFLRRHVDLFCYAFIFALVFFISLFVGFVLPIIDGKMILDGFQKIEKGVYISASIFLVGIIFSGVINDKTRSNIGNGKTWQIGSRRWFSFYSRVWVITLSFLLFYTKPMLFTATDKRVIFEAGGLLLIMWANSIAVYFMVFFANLRTKQLNFFDISLVLLLVYLVALIQIRSIIIVPLVTFFIVFFHGQGAFYRKINFKLIVASFPIVIVLILFKRITVLVKNFGFLDGFMRVWDMPLFEMFVHNFEPFNTQISFNNVVKSKFTLNMNLLWSVPFQLLLPSRIFGQSSGEYSKVIQDSLFPKVSWGMANNPFAEAYAAAGYAGIILLTIAFCIITWALDRVITRTEGILKMLVGLLCAVVVFVFHRNALFIHLANIRNFLHPVLLVLLLSSVVNGGVLFRTIKFRLISFR